MDTESRGQTDSQRLAPQPSERPVRLGRESLSWVAISSQALSIHAHLCCPHCPLLDHYSGDCGLAGSAEIEP